MRSIALSIRIPLIVSIVISCFFAGCYTDEGPARSEAREAYNKGMIVYRSKLPIFVVEQELQKLESLLESHDPHMAMSTSSFVRDYLFKTRLRLWGICAVYKNHELQESYTHKISSMKGSPKKDVDGVSILDQLKAADPSRPPHWGYASDTTEAEKEEMGGVASDEETLN